MQLINFIILCLALILTTLPARSNTSIGDVTLSKGNSVIEREDKNEIGRASCRERV